MLPCYPGFSASVCTYCQNPILALTGSEMSSNPSIKAILGVPEDREVTTKVYSTISSNINNIYLVITTFDLMFWMIIDLKRYIDLRWLFHDRCYIHLRWISIFLGFHHEDCLWPANKGLLYGSMPDLRRLCRAVKGRYDRNTGGGR